MKIRISHVSNSSTSSFMGIGVALDELHIRDRYLTDEIKSLLDKEEFYEVAEILCPWKIDENTSEAGKIFAEQKIEHSCPYGEGTHYFYISFSKMKDDETKAEFRERVSTTLNEVFDLKNKKVGIVEAAWGDY